MRLRLKGCVEKGDGKTKGKYRWNKNYTQEAFLRREIYSQEKLDRPVGHHFSLPNHSISDMILQGIEALGNHRETVRLSREKLWIRRLQTIQPHGLNIQEGND